MRYIRKVVDTTKFLDFLSVVTWPLKAPVPGWSGVMQMVHEGEHPEKSGIVFLPMIDMNASDVSCIYSTMTFICSQARHYKVTPVLTFDQPLYWKAYTIIANEPQGSALKSVVLRLGPFHMEMSFLRCIGHVMKGFGLQEVLEIIYAPNAVTHMLSGKAVARATRGHMLEKSDDDDHDDHDDDDENDYAIDNNDDVDEVANKENRKQALINSTELYDRLLYGELSVEEVCEDPIVAETYTIFEKQMTAFENNRTARLWIQYSQMLEILRTFIKAERTGNWDLHLQSVYNMLPYFAAAGHNLYAKSAYASNDDAPTTRAEHPGIWLYSKVRNALRLVIGIG
ncbi:unnamed protein product [Mytilus edulis]|uniref:Uncharacterized protein n=1 Tax=Mytilus edulis TaxID=6550 RepID=A0A8S3V8S3_MYTED|nr:unnamed protein product [Mytilus edulis]